MNSYRWLALGIGAFVFSAWAHSASLDNYAFRKYETGGDFSLTNQYGHTTRLKEFSGKVVVISFGFTHCPDLCPTTLNDLRQVLATLGDRAALVKVVFVSVDPARDTPERLRQYLAYFDDAIVGLTGSEQEIANVAARFGIRYQRQAPDERGDYAVDHDSFTFVLDQEGSIRYVVPYPEDAELIRQGVEILLAESG